MMTTLDIPEREETERIIQDGDHGLQVEWTMIGLYSLK